MINICVNYILRSKSVKVEDDVDSPQAELVAEVTNILDTLQVTCINCSFQKILTSRCIFRS